MELLKYIQQMGTCIQTYTVSVSQLDFSLFLYCVFLWIWLCVKVYERKEEEMNKHSFKFLKVQNESY